MAYVSFPEVPILWQAEPVFFKKNGRWQMNFRKWQAAAPDAALAWILVWRRPASVYKRGVGACLAMAAFRLVAVGLLLMVCCVGIVGAVIKATPAPIVNDTLSWDDGDDDKEWEDKVLTAWLIPTVLLLLLICALLYGWACYPPFYKFMQTWCGDMGCGSCCGGYAQVPNAGS
jgi:hypothetical protein